MTFNCQNCLITINSALWQVSVQKESKKKRDADHCFQTMNFYEFAGKKQVLVGFQLRTFFIYQAITHNSVII